MIIIRRKNVEKYCEENEGKKKKKKKKRERSKMRGGVTAS